MPFGFDDLIFRMLERGVPAHVFMHDGMWLDIGRVEDFQKAQELALDDEQPGIRHSPPRDDAGGL